MGTYPEFEDTIGAVSVVTKFESLDLHSNTAKGIVRFILPEELKKLVSDSEMPIAFSYSEIAGLHLDIDDVWQDRTGLQSVLVAVISIVLRALEKVGISNPIARIKNEDKVKDNAAIN